MKLSSFVFVVSALSLFVHGRLRAQDEEDAGKSKVIEALKTAEDKDELETALKKAKSKSGATDQEILEGKILWALIHEEAGYFESVVSDPDKIMAAWKQSEALLIKKSSQLQGMAHFMSALKASDADDPATAQKELLQAIWLDPDMAKERYVEKIKKIKPIEDVIDMTRKIEAVDGKKVTLAEYAKGNKALYIQIWATWCGPCVRLFPVLTSRAKNLPPQGVNVIALNSELGREKAGGGNLAKAKELKLGKNMQLPWLIEPAGSPYTERLGIDSVPRAIIVTPDGKVLFNDHPMAASMSKVMAKLGVTKFDLKAGMQPDQ